MRATRFVRRSDATIEIVKIESTITKLTSGEMDGNGEMDTNTTLQLTGAEIVLRALADQGVDLCLHLAVARLEHGDTPPRLVAVVGLDVGRGGFLRGSCSIRRRRRLLLVFGKIVHAKLPLIEPSPREIGGTLVGSLESRKHHSAKEEAREAN
mgnify:CR=1 FL=1